MEGEDQAAQAFEDLRAELVSVRRAVERLAGKGLACVVGLEIEWYLLRVAEDRLEDENIGLPGLRGRPIKTVPVEPGFSYHSESNMDLMQPVLSALAEQFARMRPGSAFGELALTFDAGLGS